MNICSIYHYWKTFGSMYAKKLSYINRIFRIIWYDVCSLDNITSHTIASLYRKGKSILVFFPYFVVLRRAILIAYYVLFPSKQADSTLLFNIHIVVFIRIIHPDSLSFFTKKRPGMPVASWVVHSYFWASCIARRLRPRFTTMMTNAVNKI